MYEHSIRKLVLHVLENGQTNWIFKRQLNINRSTKYLCKLNVNKVLLGVKLYQWYITQWLPYVTPAAPLGPQLHWLEPFYILCKHMTNNECKWLQYMEIDMYSHNMNQNCSFNIL